MKLVIHPHHPYSLAVLDEQGRPAFVSAELVLAYVADLERQVGEITRRYARLFEACENLSAQNGRVELETTGDHTHVWLKLNAYQDAGTSWVCADCGAEMEVS